MDEQQQGGAQQAAQQESPLRRLWTRLRSREPVRPTWRHFALNAAVVPLAAVISFFSIPDLNSTTPFGLNELCVWGAILLPLLFLPISLLRAVLSWHDVNSWKGVVWLLRPLLLALGLLVLFEMRSLGKVWDFEQRLPAYTEVVPLVLSELEHPLGPGEMVKVSLPNRYMWLSQDGNAHLEGTSDGLTVHFVNKRGKDVYVIGKRPDDLHGLRRHADGWYLVMW